MRKGRSSKRSKTAEPEPVEEVGHLTIVMLRLLSSKAQGCKDFRKLSKPCHVGIHRLALAEYSQTSTHVPGFQSFFRFLCIILY